MIRQLHNEFQLLLELNTTQTVVVFLAINARHWKLAKIGSTLRLPFFYAEEAKMRRVSTVVQW